MDDQFSDCGIPGVALSEIARLFHAYLSIEDPHRRMEALRMLEAIADCKDANREC